MLMIIAYHSKCLAPVEIAVGITPSQQEEMKRLKQYFPYRIVYGAIMNGEFSCGAVPTMRKIENLVKKGASVWTL